MKKKDEKSRHEKQKSVFPRLLSSDKRLIGICDTMFSRGDMAKAAIRILKKSKKKIQIVRYTVPGAKDLPVACQKLFEEKNCDIVLAFGFVGKEPIDKVCGHEASLGIQQVQLRTNRHVLEVFVHEDEATDRELASIMRNRAERHAQNAVDLLFEPQKMIQRAGSGQRQGRENAKPLNLDFKPETKKTKAGNKNAIAGSVRFNIAIVVAKFNSEITEAMLSSALETAKEQNLNVIRIVHVPGSLEIPFALKRLLRSGEIDAVACLGAVIKGDTDHDQIVGHNAARKIIDLSLEFNKPVGMGVSGPGQTWQNAVERAKPYGRHAVETVAKMLALQHRQ